MAPAKVMSKHISPQADVVFVVGSPPKVKLFVNSAILSSSSKVFAALLGPNFREGQDCGSANPKVVLLPEDNPAAMSDLCNLLHNKHEDTSKYLSIEDPQKLIPLVTVVDKYGCFDSLRITTRAILFSLIARASSDDGKRLWGLASLAYALGDSFVFKESTQRLIQDVTDSYFPLSDSDKFQMLPPIVLYALEAKRTKGRNIVTYGLVDILEEFNNSPELGQRYIEFLRTGLQARQWPPIYDGRLGASISWCANALEHFDDFGDALIYDDNFHSAASDLRGECEGLCMHCVRAGARDLVSACGDESHDIE